MKRIVIAGPIPRDTIITYKGEVIEKYGCVTHPTIALARLLQEEGEVIPVAHIHKADDQPIKKLFSPFENIDTTGLKSDQDKGTIIELKFIDQNNRLEKQLSNMAPVSVHDIEKFMNADAFVFIPITDFEIELDTLKYIKENSQAVIIFDAHGQTTRVDNNGVRLRQFWTDKDDWLPYIDVLKMNLEESQFSWFDDENILTSYDENMVDHLDEFAEYVLNKGVQTLYITLDSRGCVVYFRENGTTEKAWIPSVKVENVVDTTGCGDSFAGGLAYGLAVYQDRIKAGQYANILGALRTQGKDFDVFKSKEAVNSILLKSYPESASI